MPQEYLRDYDYQRPVYKQSNAPLVFAILMLPVFFFFGFVTSQAIDTNGGNGLEIGVGGGPDQTEIVSPKPETMAEPTMTVTPTASPSVTVTPVVQSDLIE